MVIDELGIEYYLTVVISIGIFSNYDYELNDWKN